MEMSQTGCSQGKYSRPTHMGSREKIRGLRTSGCPGEIWQWSEERLELSGQHVALIADNPKNTQLGICRCPYERINIEDLWVFFANQEVIIKE